MSGNYTVTRTGDEFTESTTVNLAVTHTTTSATDISVPASVTFAAGDDTETFQVTVRGDTLNEAAEMFSLRTTGGTGLTHGTALAVTLNDDDDISVSIARASATAATVDEGGEAMFTVTLTGAASGSAAAITVPYTVASSGSYASSNFGGDSGSISIAPGDTTGTITLRLGHDMALGMSAADQTLTVTLTADDSADDGTGYGAPVTTTIEDDDAIDGMSMELRGPATLNEESSAEYTVDLGAVVTGSSVTVMIAADAASTATLTTDYTLSATSLTIAVDSRSATFTLTTTDGGGDGTDDRTLTLTATARGGANTASMAAVAHTVTISEDDPAAREARLEAPLASAGKGIGQLAAAAVVGRLSAAGAGSGAGNSLTIAGRNITGMEVLAAHYLADGYATGERDLTAAELLRGGGFNLTGGGARGFNFWGSGEYVAAEGDHDGIDYDGDTSAFHLGLDTAWGDGLVGVAVGRSEGETDFTVELDGLKSTLETSVTSAHPYLSRRVGRAQVWATAGHGSGDAELKEDGATFKTDLTITTAAIGITRAQDAQLNAGLSALYTRAELDAATAAGKTLRATTADSLRITANAQARWTHGAMSPFLDVGLRHDSGDGDTGLAGDVGGGLEWMAPGLVVRLAGTTTVSTEASDETRAALSVRKSTGNFDLGLNLTANGTGDIDTGRLVTGEWRF